MGGYKMSERVDLSTIRGEVVPIEWDPDVGRSLRTRDRNETNPPTRAGGSELQRHREWVARWQLA